MTEEKKGNVNGVVLSASIVRVVTFFDLFSYPLTEIEIWERLDFACEFDKFLEALKVVGGLESKNGLYFLKGREGIVKKRQKQYIVSQKKWQIARRAAKILRFVSGVKMVAVCNNFSYKKDSDIDVFIVVKKNRMWLTRLKVTFNIHLAGLRRHGKKVANRICLSFYVSEDGMNLEGLMLKSNRGNDAMYNDPYFVFWMADLMPFYTAGTFCGDEVIRRFWRKNKWFKKALPNFSPVKVSQRIRVEDGFFSSLVKRVHRILFDKFLGGFFEKVARSLQKKKMSKNKHSLSRKDDSRVVVSDTVLKFHEKDRREFYRDAWFEKI